jgi:hypothetical protein
LSCRTNWRSVRTRPKFVSRCRAREIPTRPEIRRRISVSGMSSGSVEVSTRIVEAVNDVVVRSTRCQVGLVVGRGFPEIKVIPEYSFKLKNNQELWNSLVDLRKTFLTCFDEMFRCSETLVDMFCRVE